MAYSGLTRNWGATELAVMTSLQKVGGADIDTLTSLQLEERTLQSKVNCFVKHKTEAEVYNAWKNSVPPKTQADKNYCVRIWNE